MQHPPLRVSSIFIANSSRGDTTPIVLWLDCSLLYTRHNSSPLTLTHILWSRYLYHHPILFLQMRKFEQEVGVWHLQEHTQIKLMLSACLYTLPTAVSSLFCVPWPLSIPSFPLYLLFLLPGVLLIPFPCQFLLFLFCYRAFSVLLGEGCCLCKPMSHIKS